ncbi:MAG: hypothetical protein WBH98_06625 [Bacteroidales bacterium]
MQTTRKIVYLYFLLLTLLAGSLTAQTPTKYFVSWNTGNDATGDGLTWQTAFKTVGKACVTIGLDTEDGRTYTIYMAEGTYRPTQAIELTGNKTIRFIGGFPAPNIFTSTADTCNVCTYAYPTIIDIEASANASIIRLGRASSPAEEKSTNLYFRGITYDNTETAGGSADGTFLTCGMYSNNATVTLEHCYVKNYRSGPGSFIYVYGSDNHTFNLKNIYVSGGAMGGSALVTSGGGFLRIFRNIALNRPTKNNTVNVENCIFANNVTRHVDNGSLFKIQADEASGGTKVFFRNNTFCSNTHSGTGLGTCISIDGAEVTLENNTFSGNVGRAMVFLRRCYAKSIRNNVFYDNISVGQDGVAYFIEETHDLVGPGYTTDYIIDGDKFYGNSAGAGEAGVANGGAIFAKEGAPLVLRNCIFIGNKTTQSSADGGAINTNGCSKLEIDNCYFKNNETKDNGGAISATNTPVTVRNSVFIGNKATETNTYGGAIYAKDNTVSSTNSIYKNNEAYRSGGAIYHDGNYNFQSTNDKFYGNKAGITGTASDRGGGAVYFTGNLSTIAFNGCEFLSNQSGRYGGAINVQGAWNTDSDLNILYNCKFWNNRASTPTGYGNQDVWSDSRATIGTTSTPITNCYMQHAQNDYPTTGNNRFIFGTGNTFATNPDILEPMPTEHPIPPASDFACSEAITVFKPHMEATIGTDTTVIIIEDNLCTNEVAGTKVSFFSTTGMPPFTFQYRIDKLTPGMSAFQEGTIQTVTTQGSSHTIQVDVPDNNDLEGVTYHFVGLKITDAEGRVKDYTICDGTIFATVNINPKPKLDANISFTCLGPTATLNANFTPTQTLTPDLRTIGARWFDSENVTSWQWTGPNGYTSNEQNPTIPNFTSSQYGDYTVTITDNNGCSASKTVNIQFVDSNGDGIPDICDINAVNDNIKIPMNTNVTDNVMLNDDYDKTDTNIKVTDAEYYNSAGILTPLTIDATSPTPVYTVSGTLAGTITLKSNGEYTFNSQTDFTGRVVVKYTISHTVYGATSSALLIINVLPEGNLVTELCDNVPPQPLFDESTSTFSILNGVKVARILTRSLYSTAQSITGACSNPYAAGYAYLRSEDAGNQTPHSVTYTFSDPQTSVQVFLLLLGNKGTTSADDWADFSIKDENSNPITNFTLEKNPIGIDCKGLVEIYGNSVQVNNANRIVTDAAIVVTSDTPFTSLTITNPKTNVGNSPNNGFGYYVELCETSLTPLDSDNDGIPDILDLDDDNDGILDTDEMTCIAIDKSPLYEDSRYTNNTYNNAIDGSLGTYATMQSYYTNNNYSYITVDLDNAVKPEGTYIDVYYYKNDPVPKFEYSSSPTSGFKSLDPYFYTATIGEAGRKATCMLPEDARYFKVTNQSYQYPLRVYEIRYTSCTDIDTDNDGIPDRLDLDSDGDGCPDAFEGDENVTPEHLNADGSINIVDYGDINTDGVPNLVNPGGAADIGGDIGQGVGYSNNQDINLCTDTDGDGVYDIYDLDCDNDGILDIDELYCNNPDLPITTTTGKGKYKTQLGFFDFTGAEWNAIGDKITRTATYNGVTYTAEVTYIDIYNKAIPSGNTTTDLRDLNDSGLVPKFEGWDMNTWDVTNQPQMIKNYYNVNGTNFKEAIYYNKNVPGAKPLHGEASFKIDVKAEKNGVPVPFRLVVFDAEGSGIEALNNWHGQVKFTDLQGQGFQLLEKTGTANFDDVVTVTHPPFTRTAKKVELIDDNRTLCYNHTANLPGLPSDVNGLFETIDYTLSSYSVRVDVRARSGCQGFGFAVRTLCDSDSDGVPNFLDLDSDGDGCFDAIEGDENVNDTHLNADGSINIATYGGVNADGVPNLVNSGGAADIGGDVGQGAGYSKNPLINACADSDNDGVYDINDIDNDNDGILDIDELYCNNPDLPIAATVGRGQYKTQLGFFDFSGAEWNAIGDKVTRTAIYNGITYTAEVTYIDIYNKVNPGTNITTDLRDLNDSGIVPKFVGKDMDTWASGPPQMIKNYYNVNGDNFKEAIWVNNNTLYGEATFKINVKAEKDGQPVPFQLVVYDAEASGFKLDNNWPGQIIFTDLQGKGFQSLEKTGTGNYNETASASFGGVTYTVEKIKLSDDNRILYYNHTNNSPDISNVNGLFQTIDYTSSNHVVKVDLKARGGAGAFGFAVRTLCDADSDGIPNFLDLDSDGDGCYDAIEGDENVTATHLNTDGSINIAANGGVNADGVPNLVNSGGAADIGGDVGQGAGYSKNPHINACTDTDGDGVPDINDLDNDNDGILDTSELHCDNPDLPVAGTTGNGIYKNQLGFFNFAGKTWNTIGQTHSSTVTYNGVTYTAEVTYYDVDNRNRHTDDATDFLMSPSNAIVPPFVGHDINTWNNGPAQMIHRYYNVPGYSEAIAIDPNNKILRGEAKFWVKVKAHKQGDPTKPVPFRLVIFDAEATSLKINNNYSEDINFYDFGKGFQLLEQTGTGNYTDSVSLTAPGGYFSTKVPKIGLSADKRTLTYNYTDNNVPGTPSNVNALFETIEHTSSEHFIEVRIKARAGGGAFGFAVRTLCDSDSDGVPNFLDLDSDGDGCYDAIEGDENVTAEQLNTNGSISGSVNTNGVPNLVNPGGAADTGNDEGQGAGSSMIASNLEITAQPANITVCSGNTAVFSATVNITGTGNWTSQLQKYNGTTWDNVGAATNVPADGNVSATVDNVTANGTYRLVFTGENNACSVISNEITLTVVQNITGTSVVISDADCFNSSTGSFTVTVTGGTPNYTYKLMDEHGNPYTANGYAQHTHTTTSTTHTFSNLPAGLYRITVSDINGCEKEVCIP